VKYEDKVRIATPEGVELEFALGGIGSRLCARLIDLSIEAVAIVIAELIFSSAVDDSSLAGAVVAALGVLIGFAIIWVYDVTFETFNGGQTPGKRALGLRVVGEHGEPESLSTAAVRNILRIVDEFLTLWLGALISMVRSERTQRIGDHAAGTLVVKDRPEEHPEVELSAGARERLEAAAAWDTTAVTDEELSVARYFLERRGQVARHARVHLAGELAAKLRPKVPGAEAEDEDEEQFIELLTAVKAARGQEPQ
jgi:uncharacterized RDD family membrane protein YckC